MQQVLECGGPPGRHPRKTLTLIWTKRSSMVDYRRRLASRKSPWPAFLRQCQWEPSGPPLVECAVWGRAREAILPPARSADAYASTQGCEL